ncbi:hypothetical protein G1H11_17730 [Phytoactinopolyspora alkaliphila]|uniref:Uncharacterized protein n=1 Tax=Phytoactinopolyspora alkaliphila TaxID=1783498 RepID=A0A6N9YQ88_9ACTN|nr:DUF6112 family protein [Phytoactinopolyspora alkaliphila]NED97142.1 hypothetical protein [Phytoactinopolyspora alkaliphila]
MAVAEAIRVTVSGLYGSVLVFDPDIRPNEDAIPGIPALKDLLGGVLAFCLFASVGAVIASLLWWGFGRLSSNPQRMDTGKTALAWSMCAFVGFGALNTLTVWAWGIGQSIPLPGAA